MQPLTREQFRDALGKGLGRAYLHVRDFGADGLRDELLHACLESLAIDPQWEGTRGDWLFAILKRSGELESFRPPILAALQGVKPDSAVTWDYSQWMELATNFARLGCEESRRIIYRMLDDGVDDFYDAGCAVVRLDGMAGFLRVAEAVGARLRNDAEFRDESLWGYYAEKRLGERAIRTALKGNAGKSKNVAAYLRNLRQRRGKLRPARTSSKRELGLTDILVGVECGQDLDFIGFGRDADQRDVEEVFAILLQEQDTERLCRLLEVFQSRRVPFLHPRLFDLARSENRPLRRRAAGLLSLVRHPEVRRFALELLRAESLTLRAVGCELMEVNARRGDLRTVMDSLPAAGDPDELHCIAEALFKVAFLRKDREVKNLLQWIYERNSCSYCRNGAVEELLTKYGLPGLPAEQAHECRWDCLDLTRKLMRKSRRWKRRLGL